MCYSNTYESWYWELLRLCGDARQILGFRSRSANQSSRQGASYHLYVELYIVLCKVSKHIRRNRYIVHQEATGVSYQDTNQNL